MVLGNGLKKRRAVMKTKKAMVLGLLFLVVIVGIFAVWGYMSSQVEQSPYTVMSQNGAIEVRDYPPKIVAEVTTTGTRDEAIRAGFRLLADYIFGNNQSQASIAMTAPVIQQSGQTIPMTAPVTQTAVEGQWKTRFMMPAAYTMDSLPKPVNQQVSLLQIPQKRFVVIRFSGRPSENELKQEHDNLNAAMQSQNLTAISGPIYAFFNPPWTLPPLRRNEIMIEIEKPAE
jgi:hypothetical protein